MQETINIGFFQDAKYFIRRGKKSTTGEFSYSLATIFIIWLVTITYLITCAVTGSRDDLLGLIGLIPISVLLLGLSIKDINFKDNGLYSMITRFYQTILPCWFGFSFMATMFSGFSSDSITQLAIIYFPFFILLPIAIFHLTFKLAYPTLLKNRKCHPTEAISYAVLQTLCNLQLILMPIDKLPLVINKSKDNSITINCHDDKYMSTQWTPYSKKCFKNTYMNVFYQDNTKYLVSEHFCICNCVVSSF